MKKNIYSTEEVAEIVGKSKETVRILVKGQKQRYKGREYFYYPLVTEENGQIVRIGKRTFWTEKGLRYAKKFYGIE